MGDGSQYPSPRSEGPNGALAASILASTAESSAPIPRMNDPQTLNFSSLEGARPRLSVRRNRDPPKNSEGQIFCDHHECQAAPPTFRRPCEWNKHMDKHDRPYKCYEPNCDKIQGFTYSGGLLRHQREVHKKNTDAKKPLMCPYSDCNRSTGNGFTRQENLREHLRRRHMHNDEAPPMVDMTWDRPPNSTVSKALSGTDENGINLHDEVKRLRREVEEKDRRLEELERIVAGIQQAIPQQSPSAPELQGLTQHPPHPTAAPV
ncbi:uncharacterized protein N7515_004770 [Penicillium bovifimosum]|uniref:C2H2-type domain-containing protein n=1 Tax=Penicillium bovifimosum TaxID=126998 RepID=A0A9W9H0S3_9EURO|nr:uncharacterized protein N7515_004770 [Penicillium bovifimosum]KAJ5135492.1 hypothetical protein N7515_004770 [Penicillium bovifimosum]